MVFYEVNYLAVFVAAIVNMVIGALWYSPLLFMNPWMKLMKFTKKDINKAKAKGMSKNYLMAFIASLITAYVLALIISNAAVVTLIDGVVIGLWAWIGFVGAIVINGVLWEGKPWKLYWINAGQYLVTFVIMGAILAVWI